MIQKLCSLNEFVTIKRSFKTNLSSVVLYRGNRCQLIAIKVVCLVLNYV